MNREIKRIAKIMCEGYGESCKYCLKDPCNIEYIAEKLYNANYRKTNSNYREKITKQAIKKFVAELKQKTVMVDIPCGDKYIKANISAVLWEQINAIAKTLYNAGYRKVDLDNEAAKEIALLKSELKKELDEHEAFVNNMKNVLEIEKKNAVRGFVEQFKEKARKGASYDPVTYKFIERDYTATESELTKILVEFLK